MGVDWGDGDASEAESSAEKDQEQMESTIESSVAKDQKPMERTTELPYCHASDAVLQSKEDKVAKAREEQNELPPLRRRRVKWRQRRLKTPSTLQTEMAKMFS